MSELVVMDKAKRSTMPPRFRVQPQKEDSYYQTLSTTNREKPEQFRNATKKQETAPVPEIYMNIAHAKKEPQPSTGPRNGTRTATADDAADVITPVVSSKHRAVEIRIKAKPGNAASSATESDTSDLMPASFPQQSGRYKHTHVHASTEMKPSGPFLKSDLSAKNTVVVAGQNRNPPDTVPYDGNSHTLASSRKKDRNKCLLFSVVVCCVLVVFLTLAPLVAFVGLNRSELGKNQAEDSHVQSTATSNTLITNLTKQVQDMEESLNQIQTQLENLATFSQHIRVNLSVSIDTLGNVTRQSLNEIKTSMDSRFVSISRVVNSTFSSPVDLYSRCYKDVVSCTVSLHPSTAYWYRCTTPSLWINVPNYFTLGMHCQHDPDANYVDTTAIEVSDTHVRCHCNVVGLMADGRHGDLFDPLPHGGCGLVITRCPLTQTLYDS